MSGDLKYPDGIVGKILFDPIKEGADRLCVLTAEATPSMASWLLKSYEELGISDVSLLISFVRPSKVHLGSFPARRQCWHSADLKAHEASYLLPAFS